MIGQSISHYKIIEKQEEARLSWLGCQAETGLARNIKVIL